ncbi:MAG: type II secretion system F family protein [Lachnospiraceae bacterium]|nr:type II secretion system F family protein [Lachnospiraceae bacterium]
MPGFVYKAIGPDGKEKKGNIQAASEEQALARIKGDGLIPIEVTPETLLTKDINISIGGKITARDYCVFCRQMLSILGAGVSIINALQMLAEQTENKKLKRGIAQVADDVGKGETLSNAMRKQPAVFPSMFINLVEAGEATGTLEISFERMALQFEKESQLKALIKKALTYPIMVGLVAVGVIFAMMTFVIPTFMGMFADMDVEMPAITQFVINMSDFFVAYWWAIIIAAVIIIVSIRAYAKTISGKVVFGTIKLNLPVVKEVQVKGASAKFARTLSTLLRSGVPMIQALEITANSLDDNIHFKRAILGARDQVANGTALSKPIKMCGLFPPMVIHMISIGEETGNLEDMLENVAQYYEEEVATATEQMMTIMEPMIILVLALIVGVIIMAILQPMMTLYDAVESM